MCHPIRITAVEIRPSVPHSAANTFTSAGRCNLLVVASMGGNVAFSVPTPSPPPLAQDRILMECIFPWIIQGTGYPRVLRKNCLACL